MARFGLVCLVLGGVLALGACEAAFPTRLAETSADAGPAPQEWGDASATSDGAGPHGAGNGFCQSLSPAPAFCQDFDEGTAPFAGWSDTTEQGATFAIVDSEAVSKPSSLQLTYSGGGQGSGAWVGQQLVQPNAQLTFDFWVRIDSMDSSTVAIALILLGSADIRLLVANEAWVVQQDVSSGSLAPKTLASGPVLHTWQHVVWTLTMSTPMTSAISIDGNQALPALTLASEIHPAAPEIVLGRYAAYNPSPWQIEFDNVVGYTQ